MQNEKKTVTEKKSACPYIGKCGGCRWINEPYEKTLQKKQKTVEELLKPFVKPLPAIGCKDPYHYRHKVTATFGEDRRHNIISGTFEEKSHRIVPIEHCLLEHEKADAIVLSIRKLLKSFKIRPFNEDTGYGLLRHVQIRVGYNTGQIMVVLVLASPILPSKNHFVKALLKEHPDISTIILNVNERQTSMVLGKRNITLYGKGYIEDELCGKRFRISPTAFYQINPAQTEILYQKAIEFAGLTGNETVLDAYCGTGTIGLIASDYAKQVIGAELNAEAVKDAVHNAKTNGVRNILFQNADAGVFMTNMADNGEHADVVFMDPPRSGSTEAFMDAVAKLSPKTVVYVSCNPETLARDLAYFAKKNYRVSKAVGVDMFPWTEHVETVCLLSKKP